MLEILGLIMPGVTKVIDKLIPDSNARAEAKEQIATQVLLQQGAVEKAIADAAKAQTEINLEEAKNSSMFVAGWRPAVGWVCVAGLSYQFILQPFIAWGSLTFHAGAPPTLELGSLMTLLTGMLGLGAMRSYEKANAVAGK